MTVNTDLFSIISAERRRMVIKYINRQGKTVGLPKLSRAIAAEENDCNPEEVTSDQMNNVRISMMQTHLEKMDEFGVVEYDPRSKETRPTEMTSRVSEYIKDGEVLLAEVNSSHSIFPSVGWFR